MRFLIWGFLVLIGWLLAEWISLQIGISDGARFDEMMIVVSVLIIAFLTMPKRNKQ